ncbi:hypothetical protein ElyMa_004133200 [Elysia marginata]|uniref:Uncharacterized protein n=1 Tax=Elysia marginata TaxID=1093978 RepID=A0AAV4GHC5_9GAST|nr:hypothetical protein ElyMa_004133200 [Elysia marginata]
MLWSERTRQRTRLTNQCKHAIKSGMPVHLKSRVKNLSHLNLKLSGVNFCWTDHRLTPGADPRRISIVQSQTHLDIKQTRQGRWPAFSET